MNDDKTDLKYDDEQRETLGARPAQKGQYPPDGLSVKPGTPTGLAAILSRSNRRLFLCAMITT
jgi:hypothetical protein